jgi:hypothetical protein
MGVERRAAEAVAKERDVAAAAIADAEVFAGEVPPRPCKPRSSAWAAA